MKKRRKIGKILLTIVLVILAVFLLLILIYHRAAYMTLRNLTGKKLKLDESIEWENGESYLNVRYASDSDAQTLDLYVPKDVEEPELFVMIHGGGFIYGDSQTRQAQFMYRYFRDHGYACASLNYRLAQETAFPGALEDVKAAVRFLKSHADEYGYRTDHIAIWGESAGGYLATLAAVTNDEEFMSVRYIGQDKDENAGDTISAKVDVLVDYYGAVELGGISAGSDDWKTLGVPDLVLKIANSWLSTDILQGFSSVESFWMRKETSEMTAEEIAYAGASAYIDENLSSSDLMVLIVHGDCDITVPSLQSERLYEKISGVIGTDRTEFWLIKDAGHAADMLYSDEILEQVGTFIEAGNNASAE